MPWRVVPSASCTEQQTTSPQSFIPCVSNRRRTGFPSGPNQVPRLASCPSERGSAFRRPARSELHLAHLNVSCLRVFLMGSSLSPDDAKSSSSLHSVGSVPHAMYVPSHVVSSRHEARAFRRPINIRLSLPPALRSLPLQCYWVVFTGVSGSHRNHTLSKEFRVRPTLVTLS